MSMLLFDGSKNGSAVRVTSASTEHLLGAFTATPEWLELAINNKRVSSYEEGNGWKVLTPKGEVIAEPGDWILYEPGVGLSVFTLKSEK